MDKGSIIGVILIIMAIVAGIMSGGEPILSYVKPIVDLHCCDRYYRRGHAKLQTENIFAALGNTVNAFRGNAHNIEETIDTCIKLADKSRKQGLLALESESYDDPFVQKPWRCWSTVTIWKPLKDC